VPPHFMTNDDQAEIRRAFSPRLARDRRRDSRARFVYPIRELNVNVFAWSVKGGVSRARFDRETAIKVHRILHEIIVIR